MKTIPNIITEYDVPTKMYVAYCNEYPASGSGYTEEEAKALLMQLIEMIETNNHSIGEKTTIHYKSDGLQFTKERS